MATLELSPRQIEVVRSFAIGVAIRIAHAIVLKELQVQDVSIGMGGKYVDFLLLQGSSHMLRLR